MTTLPTRQQRQNAPPALVVAAKRPAPGAAKTRLCPPLTPGQAATLAGAMLDETLQLAASFPGAAVGYWPDDPATAHWFAARRPTLPCFPQRGRDLGERITGLFEDAWARGAGPVVVIGSDSPTLPRGYLEEAFAALGGADVALGPADDGGYWGVGLRGPAAGWRELFDGIAWSSNRVLTQTIARAEGAGLSVGLLPAWYDVDVAADLARLAWDAAPDGPVRRALAALNPGA